MEAVSFTDLARSAEPPLDRLALAMAAALRDGVDVQAALSALDSLGEEVAAALARTQGSPPEQLAAMAEVLGTRHGFHGEAQDYDHPDRSMLDLVIERRIGLPILLAVLWVEVGRRAGVPLSGVGLPGHFVVGHFGADRPLLADPFQRGRPVPEDLAAGSLVRPWGAQETARRMLNNLVGAYVSRMDLGHAIRAAELRLTVAGEDRSALELELRSLRARLN